MRAVLVLLVSLALSPVTYSQQADVRISASPHYVGVSIDIEITVEGFARSPEPTVEVDAPGESTLELASVSPNFSTSIQIINGQMTQHESIRFVYRYRLVADRAGVLDLGPFRVFQNGSRAETKALRFDIQDLPATSEQRFRLLLPQGPVWLGQRVPVRIEWWLTESFAERLAGRRARVPLFDYVDRFSFEDQQVTGARSTLTVDTAGGPLDLPMTVERGEWQGEDYLVVSAERTLIPLKTGTVEIEPAFIVTEETTRWSTDFFGNKVPAGVRRLRVEDEKRSLVVESPPAAGRPPSFSGAVGKGFSIQVSADRSVVQTGDPIRLSIDVRGDAPLDSVSLPRLAVSGLDSDDFKIPEGPVAGSVKAGHKRFEVVLRVRNEHVREIPPISLSWFNPELGQYETTRSRPIALSVRPATLVSATDVVRPEAPQSSVEPDPEVGANGVLDSARADADRGQPAFTLSGAELAIETRPERLQRDPVSRYMSAVGLGAMYCGGFAVLGLALMFRRRSSLSPKAREHRRTLEAERQRVAQALDVGTLAQALRGMAAISPKLPREEFDAVLVACDNVAYAPGAGHKTPVESPLRTRALAIADEILGSAI